MLAFPTPDGAKTMTERLAAWCGMTAPVVFALALVVFSAWTPGYRNLTNAVSELGATGAPHALARNAVGHVLVGFLIAAFAWGLHAGMRPEPGAIIVPVLVGLSGIGSSGLGLFPAEAALRPSTQTTLHFVMVAVS